MTGSHEDHDLPRENLRPRSSGVAMSCLVCGAAFARRDVESRIKGELVCPSCGRANIIYQL